MTAWTLHFQLQRQPALLRDSDPEEVMQRKGNGEEGQDRIKGEWEGKVEMKGDEEEEEWQGKVRKHTVNVPVVLK